MANKLRSKHFKKINIDSNKTISIAISVFNKHYKYHSIDERLELLKSIKDDPEVFLEDSTLEKIAHEFYVHEKEHKELIKIVERDVPLKIFGEGIIKNNAIQQMKVAMNLPIVEKAALMPDSHLGYGLPIGGVLATKDVVIPYAIGMDIGCRMSLTIYDINERFFKMHSHKFKNSIIDNTAFGISKIVKKNQEHSFLDRSGFGQTELLKSLKSKAARQLGSSGTGNHFVEWGLIELEEDEILDIPKGKYVGLLAHSGSRGFGASIAKHYSKLAAELSNLPHKLRHLSWLDLASEVGQEYWHAMSMAGDYAKACHDRIHINVAHSLGLHPIKKIENHHNFAWKEKVDGHELIVHRKGATPAGKNVLGIIPGSMTDPGYIVRGIGNEEAINSASHGAGRKCSRKETVNSNTNSGMKKHLTQHGVHLIGGALDESPFAYKSLNQVMSFQEELVKPIGRFIPRIVRMDRAK